MAKLQLASRSGPEPEQEQPAEASTAAPPPPPATDPEPRDAHPTAAPPPPPPPLPVSSSSPVDSAAAAPEAKPANRFVARMMIKVVAFVLVSGISLGWYFLTHKNNSLLGFLYGVEEGDEQNSEENDSATDSGGGDNFTYGARDDWPAIELSGMVAANQADQASAILNGNLAVLNQQIEGVKLVEIRGDGVVLEYKRDRKFILVGEGTL